MEGSSLGYSSLLADMNLGWSFDGKCMVDNISLEQIYTTQVYIYCIQEIHGISMKPLSVLQLLPINNFFYG